MKLDILNLAKAYHNVKALDNFTVHLHEGVYGLLGPNGAGKSTLLNILTDNVKRDGGQILLDGEEILHMDGEYRKRIGYMPQEQICYPQFSALEFLNYMALLKGLDCKKEEIREQIDCLLHELNLYDVREKRLGTFSGGMRRRAILAQALLGNPQILILDEPTAGLDPKERISMRNLIARMSKDRIVILATHISGDIECIADSVILIKEGKMIENDNPFRLMQSVRGHVREIPCTRQQMELYQEQYHVSHCIQKEEGFVLHIVEQEKHDIEDSVKVEGVSLDDVYLYYFEVK